MELHLIHFPKAGSQSSQNLSDFGPLVFETCLRRIVFLNAEASVQNPVVQQDCNLETYALEQAYRFTLEVICGLHSLIKGETEIFGQFKDFVSDNKNQIEALGLTPVFQQLLADCKFLRSTRIQHWSHNTYGSVTRKLLRSNDGVALLGAGQLAQEIAPWLKHISTKKVILRSPRAMGPLFSQFKIEMVNDLKSSLDITVLVLAADVSNSELEEHLRFWPNLRMVVDWRGDEKWVQKKNEEVFHLHDLKRNDENSKTEQDQRIQAVSAEIQRKALEFSKKAKHNPWGWEDFCA